MNKPNLTPSDIVNRVLEINLELDRICSALSYWRLNGYNGSKDIPIQLLAVEAQAIKTKAEAKKLTEYMYSIMQPETIVKR